MFIFSLVGGLKIENASSAPDANRTIQGIVLVSKSYTANLPEDLVANGVLITAIGHPSSTYVIQWLFGLNDYNRYTRVKVDDNWNPWLKY